MPPRQERRNQLYRYYRDLGFEPATARQLRDQSLRTRLDTIVVARQEIETQQQTNQSRRLIQNIGDEERRLIRARREQPETIRRPSRRLRPRIVNLPDALDFMPDELRGSASDNKENFSLWSSRNNGFPVEIQAFIERLNTSTNRNRNSSYGYRLFYRMYVIGWDENRSIRDMTDKGIGSP